MDAWVIDGSTPHDGCTHWHAQDSISAPVSTTASATSRSSGSRPSCSPTVSRLCARVLELWSREEGYVTPKIDVRGAVPRRRGAPGPRALRRSLDASRRLGRRGRDALAGRDARDRAGIGHPEPGDLARGAPRPASARALVGPLSQLEGVLSLRDAGRRAARQLRDRCGGVLRRRSSSTDVARAQHPAQVARLHEHWRKQPLPADFD